MEGNETISTTDTTHHISHKADQTLAQSDEENAKTSAGHLNQTIDTK
jgi:hypothetical protein